VTRNDDGDNNNNNNNNDDDDDDDDDDDKNNISLPQIINVLLPKLMAFPNSVSHSQSSNLRKIVSSYHGDKKCELNKNS
jgi:hypothetical protein